MPSPPFSAVDLRHTLCMCCVVSLIYLRLTVLRLCHGLCVASDTCNMGRYVRDAEDATFHGSRDVSRVSRDVSRRFREFHTGEYARFTHVSHTFRSVSRMSPWQAISSLPRACGLPSTRKVCHLISVRSWFFIDEPTTDRRRHWASIVDSVERKMKTGKYVP